MRAGWWKQLTLALLVAVFFTGMVAAQEGVWQGEKDHPMLRATLKNKDKNAKEHAAAVEVETENIGSVDPDVQPYAESGEGLLEYQVDQGPVLGTSARRVDFRDLTPGKHTITVALASTDYKDLGAKAELEVDIP